MPDDRSTVAEFAKGEADKIVVSAGDGRDGARYVDVRQYWQPPDNGGEWVPTKRGARFPAELAGAIADAIRQAGGA